MSKWIVRKDLIGHFVDRPRYCADCAAIERVPGVLTYDEQVATLLSEGEHIEGEGAHVRVLKGSAVVGFIDVYG
jgi:hypothetical protein